MKNVKNWLIAGSLAAVMAVGGAFYAVAQYATGTNYIEAGSTRSVIQGSLDVVSGGDFDIESGAAFKIAGTTVTASAAELNIVDGVEATAAEINQVADVSSRIVTITVTDAITVAEHADRINLMAEVGGDANVVLTLPEATGTGNRYKFYVGVVNTSGYVIAALTTDTMSGVIMTSIDAADTGLAWEVDADDDKLTLNGTTSGGVTIGDWIEVVDCLDTIWCVSGQITSSGGETTPASSS